MHVLAREVASDPRAREELNRRMRVVDPAPNAPLTVKQYVASIIDDIRSSIEEIESKRASKPRHVVDSIYWGMPVGTLIEPGMKPVGVPSPAGVSGVAPDASAGLSRDLGLREDEHGKPVHIGDSERRIAVHSGLRKPWEVNESTEKDKVLVVEATTYRELPEEVRVKVDRGMEALGTDSAKIREHILEVYVRAVQASNPGWKPEDGEPKVKPAGQDWYIEANAFAQQFADEFGLAPDQGAGMIAACSPQQAWGDNVVVAEYITRALTEDHPVLIDELLATYRIKAGQEFTDIDGKKFKTSVEMSLYEFAAREVSGGGKAKDGKRREMPSPDQLIGKHMSDLDPYVAAAIIKAQAQLGYRVDGIGGNVPGEDEPLNVDGVPLHSFDETADDPAKRSVVCRFTCGTIHMGRAIRIARGEQPNVILNGHKVRSFYNNIRDPRNSHDDITVDSHAFSVGMGEKWGSGSDPYKFFAGGNWKAKGQLPVKNNTYGVEGMYSVFADAYREVAKSLKPPLTARQLQAITWVQWRKDHPDTERGQSTKPKKGKKAKQEVEDVEED
jgi:hypothetical protein